MLQHPLSMRLKLAARAFLTGRITIDEYRVELRHLMAEIKEQNHEDPSLHRH